jgi:hypothetical protein
MALRIFCSWTLLHTAWRWRWVVKEREPATKDEIIMAKVDEEYVGCPIQIQATCRVS